MSTGELRRAVVVQSFEGNGGFVIPHVKQTSLIPPDWVYRDVPMSVLVGEGMPVPQELVDNWGLRFFDEVGIEVSDDGRRLTAIRSVWKITNPKKARERPRHEEIATTPGMGLRHPREEWGIDILGSVAMRAFRAVAPIGVGILGFIKGPYGVGKTWVARDALSALLYIAESRRNMAFVILQADERPADVAKLYDLLATHRNVLTRSFTPVKGLHGPLACRNAAEAALNTAKRLFEGWVEDGSGGDVVYIFDSLTGGINVYDRVAPPGSIATTGGVSNYALTQIDRHTSLAGWSEERSITGLYTVLTGEGTDKTDRTFRLAGGPTSMMIWSLTAAAPYYPKIDVRESRTREVADMFSSDAERLALHQAFERHYQERRSPVGQFTYILELASMLGSWGEVTAEWKKRWAVEDREMDQSRFERARQDMVNLAARVGGMMSVNATTVVSLARLLRLNAQEFDRLSSQAAEEAQKMRGLTSERVNPEASADGLAHDPNAISVDQYQERWKQIFPGDNQKPLSNVKAKKLVEMQLPLDEFEQRLRACETIEQLIEREMAIEDESP